MCPVLKSTACQTVMLGDCFQRKIVDLAVVPSSKTVVMLSGFPSGLFPAISPLTSTRQSVPSTFMLRSRAVFRPSRAPAVSADSQTFGVAFPPMNGRPPATSPIAASASSRFGSLLDRRLSRLSVSASGFQSQKADPGFGRRPNVISGMRKSPAMTAPLRSMPTRTSATRMSSEPPIWLNAPRSMVRRALMRTSLPAMCVRSNLSSPL